MREEDRQSIFDMIDKMKDATTVEERIRCSADLKTLMLIATDPELEMAENRPVILTQGARTYRAYPIMSRA